MSAGDGDVIRGVLRGTMTNGDEFNNIFTWLYDKVTLGDDTDAQIGAIVADAIELLFLQVVGEIKATTSFDTVDVYKRAGTVWDYLTTVVPAITPVAGTDDLPPGVAMLATAYTAKNKIFGRKYIYGVCEADVAGGALAAAALAAMADFADEYLSKYNGGAMGPLDYLVPGVWSTSLAAFEPFNGVAVVKNVLSYQRRRKTNVGV